VPNIDCYNTNVMFVYIFRPNIGFCTKFASILSRRENAKKKGNEGELLCKNKEYVCGINANLILTNRKTL
jgi:hypothetical protein